MGKGNGGFKIQDSRFEHEITPYDGISPEVIENKEGGVIVIAMEKVQSRGVRTALAETSIHASPCSGSMSVTPDSCLLSPALQKMKVTPGMLMKTKEGEKQVSGIRCQVSGRKVRGPESEVRRPERALRDHSVS